MCLQKCLRLFYLGLRPLCPYYRKFSILCHVEVGVFLVGIWWRSKGSWVILPGQAVLPHHFHEGYVQRWLHNTADVTVVYSFLWCRKGCRIGVKELHHFDNYLIVWISFDQGECLDSDIGYDIVDRISVACNIACLYVCCSIYLN